MRWPGVAGVAAVAFASGALLGAVLLADHMVASPVAGAELPEPFVVAVTIQERAESAVVGLTAVTAPGAEVRTGRSGVVTALRVATDRTVVAGEVVATIDDQHVVAMQSEAPLHRDLAPGAVGEDVQRLQQFLSDTGYLDGAPDGRFGAATGAAVRAFNAEHGLSGSGSTFEVTAVAWIGPEPVEVGDLSVGVGSVVDAGAVLFTGPELVIEITVTEPVRGLGETPGGHLLEVGGVTVAYTAGTGRIGEFDDVVAVVAALSGEAQGSGRVRVAVPQKVIVVPATAVVTGPTQVCIYPDARAQPIAVQPVGGQVGTVDLPAETPIETILVNPGDLTGLAPCG